jgi:ferredoxin
MDTPVNIRKGMYCYASNPKSVETLGFPNARPGIPLDDDWQLPENWQEIIHEGIKERLEKFRSFKIFMDICVRCGACADKCHFFIGTGDPKNMPVLRAELLRSVYRNDFTTAGKILGRLAGPPHDPGCAQRVVVLSVSSAPSAAAVRCSAPTASTRPRSPSWAASCSTCWA